MSKEKQQSLFTIVYDDFIRSPNLTDAEFRLYMIMLSYCTKKRSDAPKVCKLTQEVMAGLMRVTVRNIYNLLRSLEQKSVISTAQCTNSSYPVYEVATSPPDGLCPEELRGSRTKDAADYIRNKGGVKALQRQTYKKRKKKVKPTGRPNRPIAGAADDNGQQPPVNASLADSPPGNGFPGDPEIDFHPPGNGFPHTQKSISGSPRNRFLPVDDVHQESFSEGPNGPASQLALSRETSRTPRTSVADEKQGCTVSDIRNDPEDDVAQESPEQKAERLARRKAQRKGTRAKINDVAKADEAPQTGAKKKFRGAGPPLRRRKDGTQEVVENILTTDPELVTEVPDSPWGLYGHFCRVVRRQYQDAQLPPAASKGKYLKWSKELLGIYTREQIYEMIQVFVKDYDNLKAARIFFKFSGTPTPTFDQFYCNHAMWLTYVGKGIVSPPGARYSAYAESYNRRMGKKNDISNEGEAQGRTEVDPIEALRDQVNG